MSNWIPAREGEPHPWRLALVAWSKGTRIELAWWHPSDGWHQARQFEFHIRDPLADPPVKPDFWMPISQVPEAPPPARLCDTIGCTRDAVQMISIAPGTSVYMCVPCVQQYRRDSLVGAENLG